MNYLKDISTKLKSIDIEESVANVVDTNEPSIRKWITDRWLTGKTTEGNILALYSSKGYANEKYRLNSLAGFGKVDLTYSGLMGRNIEISGFNNEFEVFSRVPYYADISEKYGEGSFNIKKDEKEKLDNKVLDNIFNQIDKIYGK